MSPPETFFIFMVDPRDEKLPALQTFKATPLLAASA
jgi:hypothetical protein